MPEISLIIPTRNESESVDTLIQRLRDALPDVPYEVVFVDDSSDHTPEIIERASLRSDIPIRLIRRNGKEREGGLSTAVVAGSRVASGKFVCVMDADLQHPPEMIPRLLERAKETDADILVASRYAGARNTTGLGRLRFAISRASTIIAQTLFAGRLQSVTDPLSGFFLVRRGAVDFGRLRPRGFKILLEILVRFPGLRVAEVPFDLRTRHAGKSKASIGEGFRYLWHLFHLDLTGGTQRLVRFGIVGASGLVVNSLLLVTLTDLVGLFYLLSAVIATQGSTLWNFGFTEAWVFGDRASRWQRFGRLARFLLMNNITLGLRVPLLVLLASGLEVHYLLSNLISFSIIGFIGLARYLISDRWIWSGPSPASQTGLWSYDIHGVIGIESEVRLRELEYFRTSDTLDRPDVNVRIERSPATPLQPGIAVSPDGGTVSYQEGIGPARFGVEITFGEFTEIVASPLLKRSPHVLYTNVVEPILRWSLVRKGYVLVHAACLAFDEGAMLVSGRTDTGKTTTVLRTLSRHSCEFLSDDMTILSRDGRAMCYPKPLTLSRHTLRAVDGASLSFRERLALQVQSRVHSRSGRQAALTLTRSKLPMAALNAVVQILVPPPKYGIERLVPDTTISREARPCHLVLIERGPDLEVRLDQVQAVEALLENCEDAYRFPPYPAMESFLCRPNEEDLRSLERAIITEALDGCAATLIRSQNLDWWRRLPALLDVATPRGN